jgi:hypothetical protein
VLDLCYGMKYTSMEPLDRVAGAYRSPLISHVNSENGEFFNSHHLGSAQEDDGLAEIWLQR